MCACVCMEAYVHMIYKSPEWKEKKILCPKRNVKFKKINCVKKYI